MEINKYNKWIQLGANVGILAGLFLVGLQIQQNSELTRAALFSDYQDTWTSINNTMQSEFFAEAMAAAVEDPENLSVSQMVELRGYMYSIMEQFTRSISLYQLGVFQIDPAVSIGTRVNDVFGNRYAQAWWAENRLNWSLPIRNIIDDEIPKVSPNEDLENFRRIKERLTQAPN